MWICAECSWLDERLWRVCQSCLAVGTMLPVEIPGSVKRRSFDHSADPLDPGWGRIGLGHLGGQPGKIPPLAREKGEAMKGAQPPRGLGNCVWQVISP